MPIGVAEKIINRNNATKPTNLTSQLSKTCERLVGRIFQPALEANGAFGANQFASIADVVNDPVFNDRGRADPLLRPVIHAPLAELVMDRLPEELSIGSGEAHNIALVADDVRVPLALVVGADKHPSIGDAWVAIALRP